METWPRELGKGIDDLLASGHEPTLLAGEDAHAAVNEIVAEATGVSRILKNAVSATELGHRVPKPRWIVPGIVPEAPRSWRANRRWVRAGSLWARLWRLRRVASPSARKGLNRVRSSTWPSRTTQKAQSRLKKLLPGGTAPEGLELATGGPGSEMEALMPWKPGSTPTRMPDSW